MRQWWALLLLGLVSAVTQAEFASLVDSVIDYRETTPIVINDFAKCLITLGYLCQASDQCDYDSEYLTFVKDRRDELSLGIANGLFEALLSERYNLESLDGVIIVNSRHFPVLCLRQSDVLDGAAHTAYINRDALSKNYVSPPEEPPSHRIHVNLILGGGVVALLLLFIVAIFLCKRK